MHPLGQHFFIFMQFSRQIGQIVGWHQPRELALPMEFLTIRSHLYFKPEFTSIGLKNFSKQFPSSTGI